MRKDNNATNSESLYYDIHGFLGIRINRTPSIELVKDINQPLSYFGSDFIKEPDIILNIGEFNPQNDHCDVVDHKIYVKKGYLYSEDFIGQTKCNIEILGIESPRTTINVWYDLKRLHKLLIPHLIAQNIFLRPIIDFKLTQKKIISMHAAGFAKNGKALVLSGRGGAFKTTIVMDMIRNYEYNFVGEDRLLLGNDGNVYPYPIYHKLFSYRLEKMATEEFHRFDKIKYLLYQINKGENPDYISKPALLQALCSIVKHDGPEMETSRIPQRDMVKKIVMSQQMENIDSPGIMGINTGKIFEFFSGYAYKFPRSKVASYWNDYRELLSGYLTRDTYAEIYIPKSYYPRLCDELLNTIEKVNFK